MKYILTTLLLAGGMSHGATIYEEPVRVSGSGWASEWREHPWVETGFNLQFYGSNSEIDLSVQVSAYEIGGLGRFGYTIPPGRGIGHAWVGGLSSPYFAYSMGVPGSQLTLFDQMGNVITSVPIIGYFSATLTEYRSSPDGRFLAQYVTQVLPTPEPTTWALLGIGVMALLLMSRAKACS